MSWEGVISLGAHRKPVCWTIHIRQGWDGELAVYVKDIADDARSRKAAIAALRRAADLIEDDNGT
jgi:hypothetical protein